MRGGEGRGCFGGARMSLWGRIVARINGIALGAAVATAAAFLPCPALDAQVVRGLVTERASNVPLDGVVSRCSTRATRIVVQVLSNDVGGFEIRLPAPGTYSLDVKRIGVKRVHARSIHRRRRRDPSRGHLARAAAGSPELRQYHRPHVVRSQSTGERPHRSAVGGRARRAHRRRHHARPNDGRRFRRSLRAQARCRLVARAVREPPESLRVDGPPVPEPAGRGAVRRRLRVDEPGWQHRLLRA